MKVNVDEDLTELLKRPCAEVRAALPKLIEERNKVLARLAYINTKIFTAANLLSAWEKA